MTWQSLILKEEGKIEQQLPYIHYIVQDEVVATRTMNNGETYRIQQYAPVGKAVSEEEMWRAVAQLGALIPAHYTYERVQRADDGAWDIFYYREERGHIIDIDGITCTIRRDGLIEQFEREVFVELDFSEPEERPKDVLNEALQHKRMCLQLARPTLGGKIRYVYTIEHNEGEERLQERIDETRREVCETLATCQSLIPHSEWRVHFISEEDAETTVFVERLCDGQSTNRFVEAKWERNRLLSLHIDPLLYESWEEVELAQWSEEEAFQKWKASLRVKETWAWTTPRTRAYYVDMPTAIDAVTGEVYFSSSILREGRRDQC